MNTNYRTSICIRRIIHFRKVTYQQPMLVMSKKFTFLKKYFCINININININVSSGNYDINTKKRSSAHGRSFKPQKYPTKPMQEWDAYSIRWGTKHISFSSISFINKEYHLQVMPSYQHKQVNWTFWKEESPQNQPWKFFWKMLRN